MKKKGCINTTKNKSKIRTLLPINRPEKNGEINRFRVHKYSDSRTVPTAVHTVPTALHTVPKLVAPLFGKILIEQLLTNERPEASF